MIKYKWIKPNDIKYKNFMKEIYEKRKLYKDTRNRKVDIIVEQKINEIQRNAKNVEKLIRDKFSTTDELILHYENKLYNSYIEVDGRDGINIFEIKATKTKASRDNAKQKVKIQYERLLSIIGKNNFNYYCIMVVNDNKKTDNVFYPIDINKFSGNKELINKFHYNYIHEDDLDKIDDLNIIIYAY